MELKIRIVKQVIKNVVVAIVFWIIGITYGSIFNFILSGKEDAFFLSYVVGILVGFFAVTIYLFLIFFLRYCFDQEFVTDKFRKTATILINVVAFVGMNCGTVTIISNNEAIPLDYVWMHIVNLLFVSVVVGMSNHNAKVLRNLIKESEKHKHLTEPTDEVV